MPISSATNSARREATLISFIAWVAVTVPFAASPAYSFKEFAKLLQQGLIFYVVGHFFRDGRSRTRLVWLLVGGLFVVSAYGIVQFGQLIGASFACWAEWSGGATAWTGFARWRASVVSRLRCCLGRIATIRAWPRPRRLRRTSLQRCCVISATSTEPKMRGGPEVKGHRPSADVLFASVAAVYGSRAAGLLMTGMGDDGADGLQRIKAAGGTTLVQSEETCVVAGMPGAAIGRGCVDRVIPLEDLPQALADLYGNGRGGPQDGTP